MHCTSMGKAMLSLMEPSERVEQVSDDLHRPTPHTLVGAELLAELELVRAQGYAIDDEENEEGVRCIGVALQNASGETVGALSVSAPVSRFSLEDCRLLAPDVVRIAAMIGQQLGFRKPGRELSPSAHRKALLI